MAKRRKGDVNLNLFAKTDDKQVDKSTSEQGDKTSSEQNTKTLSKQDDKVVEQKKERMTVYLAPSIALDLDAAQTEIKRLTKLRGYSVSKSIIVEKAVEIVLEDLKKNGETSQLVNKLTWLLDVKSSS